MFNKIKNYVSMLGNTTMVSAIIFLVFALVGFPIVTLFLWMFDTIILMMVRHPIVFMIVTVIMAIVSTSIAKKFVEKVKK